MSEKISRMEGGRVGVEGTVGGTVGHEVKGGGVTSIPGVSGMDSRGRRRGRMGGGSGYDEGCLDFRCLVWPPIDCGV